MMTSPLLRRPLQQIYGATIALLGLIVTPSLSADWAGTEASKNGVVHIMNPAAPVQTPVTKAPRELWRVGGEDDEEVIFGVISSIAVDREGRVYLLDSQLNEVHVFSGDGEFLEAIGREGEGPGEFRRAEDMFITDDGNVAVIQAMPGKIVQFTTAGDPLDNLKLPEREDGSPIFLSKAYVSNGQLVLRAREFKRNDTGATITSKIIRINSTGEVTASYNEVTRERNMANFAFDEEADREVLFAGANDGRVYTVADWNKYAINVYNNDGKLDQVIEREYESRKRSAEEKELNKPRFVMRGRRGRGQEAKFTAADFDRDVQQLFARNDGSLWVVNSRGASDAGEGILASFDVFDSDGRFVEQIAFQCEGNFRDDGIHFVGNKMFIVKGWRSSRDAMRGGDSDDTETEEDLSPLAVICYDVSQIVRAGK